MYKDTCAAYGLGEPACGNRIRKEGVRDITRNSNDLCSDFSI